MQASPEFYGTRSACHVEHGEKRREAHCLFVLRSASDVVVNVLIGTGKQPDISALR